MPDKLAHSLVPYQFFIHHRTLITKLLKVLKFSRSFRYNSRSFRYNSNDQSFTQITAIKQYSSGRKSFFSRPTGPEGITSPTYPIWIWVTQFFPSRYLLRYIFMSILCVAFSLNMSFRLLSAEFTGTIDTNGRYWVSFLEKITDFTLICWLFCSVGSRVWVFCYHLCTCIFLNSFLTRLLNILSVNTLCTENLASTVIIGLNCISVPTTSYSGAIKNDITRKSAYNTVFLTYKFMESSLNWGKRTYNGGCYELNSLEIFVLLISPSFFNNTERESTHLIYSSFICLWFIGLLSWMSFCWW